MTAIAICLGALAACWVVGRRSFGGGLATLMAVGYAYGLVRANLPHPAVHFLFDAAVLGLYAAQLGSLLREPPAGPREAALRRWVALLAGWPILLFFLPVLIPIPSQDLEVAVVGLRGNLFLLPFLLLAARLDERSRRQVVLATAVLNLAALGVAAAEFWWGVDRLVPFREDVTTIIYNSQDVAEAAWRIPSSFVSAHAYAGTMVLTLPWLLAAWLERPTRALARALVLGGLVAAVIGCFMAAVRMPVVLGLAVVSVALIPGRGRKGARLALVMALAVVGWMVATEPRLQRFTTLGDLEMTTDRVSGSVHGRFWDLVSDYPLGNGLGGGGTSMPYFLQDRVRAADVMENEYARILLEQGWPGLMLWVGFVAWVVTAPVGEGPTSTARRLSRVACLLSFLAGLVGVGLLTSIPGTVLLLLQAGWIGAANDRSVNREAASAPLSSDPVGVSSRNPLWSP